MSNGNQGAEGIEYRERILELFANSKGRSAMAAEVYDVRRVARDNANFQTKYNLAMKEMLEYARSIGLLEKPKK